MDDFRYEHNLSNLIRNNFIFIFWGIIISAAVIFLGFQVERATQHQRTILLPDRVDRKVVVTDDHVPLELIEEYTEKICGYAFNFTPATARDRFGKLIQYFHPDDFPSAKQTFYELAETIERTKVSSSFIINRPIEVDTEKMIITVSGTTRMWVEGKFLPVDDKTYLIAYKITKGLWQLKSVDEKVQGMATIPEGGKK